METASVRELWLRVVAAAERRGGSVIALAEDETLRLYDTPTDPERAAALSPPLDAVRARRPPDFAAWLPTGGWLVSVPDQRHALSFAVLPPRAAAQLTGAMGEPGKPWPSVVAERRAGHSTFPFIVFAASDLSDVHGWAFGPVPDATVSGALGVWVVEDGAACVFMGSFETWLRAQLEKLECLDRDLRDGDEDDDDDDDDDDDEPYRPTRLNDL